METLQIITAVIISAAFMLLLWSIKALLMRLAARAEATRDGFILTGTVSAAELENTVRCLLWKRSRLGQNFDIVILDEGLDEEKRQMAEIFSRENSCVKIISCRNKDNSE
ncbi:MAG: hypothetical protein GXY26_02745 [Clostridiales bacterium]|nr:hypothetical protein [Clostridiales bacterium]